jgi:fructokinase
MNEWYGGIEAGGTKFVCAVGSNPDNLHKKTFDTTNVEETLTRAVEFFKGQNAKRHISAVGIGSFGPIDLRRGSATYGFITSTPKEGWANTDIVGRIKALLDVPVGFDTDANAAALGEHHWGAGRELSSFIYLTIGTGIGGGGIINSKLLHGLAHPEMGHICIPQHVEDTYLGRCPFHNKQRSYNCFEGLASGPAMEERWGQSPQSLSNDHKAWDLEAYYISLALVTYIFTLSPQRIIIGGGVMKQERLITLIQENVNKMLNNYVQSTEITESIRDYIVLPKQGDNAGVLGAIELAKLELAISLERNGSFT